MYVLLAAKFRSFRGYKKNEAGLRSFFVAIRKKRKFDCFDGQNHKVVRSGESDKKSPVDVNFAMTGLRPFLLTKPMGSPKTELDDGGKHLEDESPQHEVQISRDFYIGHTEVTQGQWKAIMGTEPWKGHEFVKEGENYPASYVSWNNAIEFCKRLS